MPTPFNEAHVKAFKWFALGWLLAVAGSSVVVVVSGAYEWTRVLRTAFSMGVMPILSCYFFVIISTRSMREYQERNFPQK